MTIDKAFDTSLTKPDDSNYKDFAQKIQESVSKRNSYIYFVCEGDQARTYFLILCFIYFMVCLMADYS